MISRIERELGRELDASRRLSIATLNELPPDMVDDLRRLSPLAADLYLRYHLKQGSETAFEDFMNDVIVGGMDPQTWGYRDSLILVEETSRGGALTMSVESTRALLSQIDGERWRYFWADDAPRMNQMGSSPSLGAPGVFIPRLPYWWKPPHRALSRNLVGSLVPTKMLPDRDFGVAFRRWIARRVTWWAQHASVDLATATAEGVAAAVGIDASRVSADGGIALAALLREAKLPFNPTTQVRGYIGPDDWYT